MEIKPSPNPFFQSTSSDIGVNAKEEIEWKINGEVPPFEVAPFKSDGNFLFLYSRESDVIGSKVPKPVVEEKKVLTKTEFLKKKREMVEMARSVDGNGNNGNEELKSPSQKVEALLEVYKHEPKYEDPRYTTANVQYRLHISSGNLLNYTIFNLQAEYGKKKPSVATAVLDRKAIPQGFSKGFNRVKPENTSLTTALTRSNVHKALDPLF